ncbi:unnamed protein product [Arctogadus glacialis]
MYRGICTIPDYMLSYSAPVNLPEDEVEVKLCLLQHFWSIVEAEECEDVHCAVKTLDSAAPVPTAWHSASSAHHHARSMNPRTTPLPKVLGPSVKRLHCLVPRQTLWCSPSS